MKTLPIQFSFNKVGKFLKPASVSPKKAQPSQDSFSKVQTQREEYLDKLYALFPKKQLNRCYTRINQDFGIDYPARLNFNASKDKNVATGYSFNNNTININLCELLDKRYKVVDKRNGRTLISSYSQMPLFLTKEEAIEYKNSRLSSNCAIIPITPQEQRKYILHKIAHEVVKTQQFMIMRQTERIGDKGILKAQNHSDIIKRAGQLDNYATYLCSGTFWKNHETPQTISKDCTIGQQALIWLCSLEDAAFDACQKDANQRASNYIKSTFGWY